MSQIRKMKRQKAFNQMGKKSTQKKFVTQTQEQQQQMQVIGDRMYYQGLQKGIQTMTLFAIDCLEKTAKETKGIGEKKGQALVQTFNQNLHDKSVFDVYMNEMPKGEVYIVTKEDQKTIQLVKDVQAVVHSPHSLLTEEDILSILNYEVTTHDELLSIIGKLKGVTNSEQQR